MTGIKVPIVEKILNANDQLATEIQNRLDAAGIFGINVMASPGSGKTSVILQTLKRLPEQIRATVIEGDTAPVTIDSDKITAIGVPAVQINTGGECHLDAVMLGRGLAEVNLTETDLIIVENVGNLICPAAFNLGTHANVLIASIPEGDDKPYKYPNVYRGLDILIINKTDLLPYIDFDMQYFRQGVEMLNPGLVIFELSCKTGEGFEPWLDWLVNRVRMKRNG